MKQNTSSHIPRRLRAALGRPALALLAAGWFAFSAVAQTTLTNDYLAVTSGLAGTNLATSGSPGSVAMHGTTAFPFVLSTASYAYAVGAAGRFNDGTNDTEARAAAWGHTGWLDTSGGARSQLFENAVKWASRKTVPSTITVGVGPGISTTFFTGRGYLVKSVSTSMSSATDDLTGCDVWVGNFHSGYSANAIAKIRAAATNGVGVVCAATPWALSAGALADANGILGLFGLTFSGSGPADATFPIPAAPYSPLYSAIPALDQMIAEKQGSATMTLTEKNIAANAVDQVLAVRTDNATVNAKTEQLSTLYGWITPTQAAPLTRSAKPVEAMLARYQSGKFDNLAPGALFVHPGASDWPGLPAAGSPVSRVVSVNGNTPADFYMNQGDRPTRIETGLYAAPGAVITLTIPADKTNANLQVHFGGTQDSAFNLGTWYNFPKIWRRVALTNTVTQVGHVFGGLVTLLVPAGSSLGTFNVTVDGALEAPAFNLSTDTDATWNSSLRWKPGAWGYLQTSNIVIYLPRWQLTNTANLTAIATHWAKVLDTGDRYLGYAGYRQRGEAMAALRQVAYGAAYAGYPIELGWAGDTETELNSTLLDGNWGSYHELGHTYQDDFNSAFVIATHAEVDVNLLPGLAYTLIHDRTPWDNNTHSTWDATSRLNARTSFMALAPSNQTWSAACGNATGYDFYFNLSEAFGWQVYSNAFGRLMRWLQGGADAELSGLNSGDANYKRNRFYLLMCDAAQRNLDSYFQRYGLGVPGRGYDITQGVKDQVAAKGYPTWIENQAPMALTSPGSLNVPEDAAPGTVVGTFTATDPDVSTIWTYEIAAGNSDGAWVLDKRTGALKVGARGLDYERATSYALTVTVFDNGVPRYFRTNTVTINVSNVPDVPRVSAALFAASNSTPAGTVIGTVSATVEPGRTVAGWAIVAGNAGGGFAVNSSGQVTVQLPASLPNPGLAELTLRATDSAGQIGYGTVRVVCNSGPGLYERRWTGQWVTTGSPAYTGTLTSFTTAQNVADNYTRLVTGWLVPPVSGEYTFWIASDDDSRLYLSSDASETNKAQIAAVSGWVNFQSWDSQGGQKSATFTLTAGRPYYLEALQVEGGGGDHLAAAWQGPGFSRQVIPGSALIPARPGITPSASAPAAPQVALTSPADGATFPAPATIPLAAGVVDNFNTITKVQFFQGTNLLAEDFTAPFSYDWTGVPAGNYPLGAKLFYGAGLTVDAAPVTVTVNASGLPSPWTTNKIGTVTGAVGVIHTNGVFMVTGGGANISGKNDNFWFMNQPWSGDAMITARVASQQNSGSAARAGVMFRESTATGSRSVFVGLAPTGGAQWVRRSSNGGNSSTTTASGVTAPYWVRLTRSGNTFTGYLSPNGTSWSQIASASLSVAGNYLAGLAVCSGSSGTTNLSVFENVSVTNVVVAGAAPVSPSPAMLGSLQLGDGQVSFIVTGDPDSVWMLEESSDGGNWTALETIALVGGSVYHEEGDDRRALRLFRLKSGP